mmetsp:Transcript_26069/g.63624  ORF Transcript_26069/g.63624 Transcript_26069/m.63624 type:complete len:355 (-) Transcript_26069:259-1323(-)|eukprot:CAMPEP_0113660602 /NCGR_PEP_ID=MMETSP0017_2-20120614/32989_1 /TAXON_ID=2856 /ORGANISM="Cylindrotheca closterium" /LENGTH=354 /DNA_ID=CAMNT_0000575251 /DNA_START=71 /DNA_END=1135 /DNA_ORIENTATION=+ /assembly_acc=CAM_ASM_000147
MLKAAKNVFKADQQECPVVPLEPRRGAGNEIAVVACGHFIAPQEKFLKLEGVERVILGYTGGGKEIPTFVKIHNHTEALLIEFNPNTISYSQILLAWRECVDPWEKEKTQYRAAIFWKTLSQQNEALVFIDNLRAEQPTKVFHVEVERARRFFRAQQTYAVLPLDPKNEGNEVAVLACGNVNGLLNMFEEIGGVDRVVTGLTGGKQENPKDGKPLDHTFALLVEFTPALTSYRQVLELWHECEEEVETTQQTRSAIFWKTLPQQDLALEFVEELQAEKPSSKVSVDIERVHKFYEVEVYPNNAATIVSPIQGSKASSPKNSPVVRPGQQKPRLSANRKPCLSEVTTPVWKTNRK